MKDDQVKALNTIKAMDGRLFITAAEASPACGFSEQSIRYQAKADNNAGRTPGASMGFRCMVAGNRVNIYRSSFIKAMEGGNGLED